MASSSAEASAYKLVHCTDGGDFPVKLEGRGNEWSGNLVWMPEAGANVAVLEGMDKRTIPFGEWTAGGYDHGSLVADPLFASPETDDFRLAEDSPAYRLGFEPIPFDRIGLYAAAGRRSQPLREAEGIREYPMQGDHIGLHQGSRD